MSKALLIIDVQNEFSAAGKRPVPGFNEAIAAIKEHIATFRHNGLPIAWVRHFNKPSESKAFAPDTWGSEFYPGFGPDGQYLHEKEFEKNVYGAFTGTDIGNWLVQHDIKSILIVGFYTHGCVSTTAREAIMRDLHVFVDPAATGSCDMIHDTLGKQSAEEVKRSALLHLENMGVSLYTRDKNEA